MQNKSKSKVEELFDQLERALARQRWLEAKNLRLQQVEQRTRQISETLQAATLALTQSLELDIILETLLDYLAQLVPYDTACVMLLEAENRMVMQAIRGYERWTDPVEIQKVIFDPRTTPTVRTLVTTRKSVLIPDTTHYPGWEIRPGTDYIRNWLGVPLIANGTILGMYSVDKADPDFFTQEHLRLAELLAGHAAVAIENSRLYRAGQQELAERRQTEATLRASEQRSKDLLAARTRELTQKNAAFQAAARFFPPEILSLLKKKDITEVELGDQVEESMTIMFADIRSFTTLSEQMTPQENFNFINDYFSRVSPTIRQHRGFIDKYMGDSLMALFPTRADFAIDAAVAMQQAVAGFNAERAGRGEPSISIGVGLHTGRVMLGTVGEAERMEGTVISDAVNLAARLEGLTKLYAAAVIVSEKTLFNLSRPTRYNFRFLDKVMVKGKKAPVSVFEILDGNIEEMVELKLNTRTDFERGLLHYHSQEFQEAERYFSSVLEVNPADRAARLYLRRVNHFIEYGVPAGWEGIETLIDK